MIDRIRKPESTPIFTFDKGVSFLEELIKALTHPAIIAIHGQPNSGKSLLCKRILSTFASDGKYGYMAYPDEIYSVPYDPAFYLLQDTPPHYRATQIIRNHFKREPDARVLIGPIAFLNSLQNAEQEDIRKGDYTIIIENDQASKKSI